MKLANSTDAISVSSSALEGQGVNRRVNLRDLVPKFDAKKADINLFSEIFERQAKKEKVAEDRWVSQLIPLLPMEIAEIIAKEPLEKSNDYPQVKNLLLPRFQPTPIALRDRFESHQRRPGAMWADVVFELRSYLDNWLAGMKTDELAALKELLVTEQIKKAPSELVDHFLDSWDGFKEAKSLAEKLDHFRRLEEYIKKQVRRKHESVEPLISCLSKVKINQLILVIDELKQVITKNKDVFSPDPGTTYLMRMDIELISDKPIKTKPYRMSPRQINTLREEIKHLLELGVIEIGQDSRKSECGSLSNCDGFVERLLSDSAHAESSEIRSFRYSICHLYPQENDVRVNDIAIFSQGWKDHVKHIDIVLGRLRKAGLKVTPSKCKFAQEDVLFLEHRIGSGSRSPNDLKIKAIADFPQPTTKTQVRSFLGLVGYYSHYIPNYSTIASPLTDALKRKIKKEKIIWDEKCGKAFEELKAKLISQPILFAPDFSTEFILQTDASLEKPKERGTRERAQKRAGRFGKRCKEDPGVLDRDADQESWTRIRKNALRTVSRQAVERATSKRGNHTG
ncbi:retrovirus-related Pol polyprotein from transposon 297 [Trichonephila clavipes]|nr:retrovirus-related Pol polyprotein from transposon 297 [Trichonephila clavipes]